MCDPARLNYCWACSNKLLNGIHAHKEIDGHDRILHKECAGDDSLAMSKLTNKIDHLDECPKCKRPFVTIAPGACVCWQYDPFGI